MSAKTIVLSVSHIDDEAADSSSTFIRELSEEEISRIKQLSDAAIALNADFIEVATGGGIWSDLYYADAIRNGSTHEEAVAEAEKIDNRIDSTKLQVFQSCFSYKAIPKFYGEAEAMYTSSVPISELFGDELVIVKGFGPEDN